MKRLVGALAVATATVIAVSYVGWSAPADHPMGVHHSRSHGQAVVVDTAELARLIGGYEARLHTDPNAADYAFLGQLYLQRGRQTGDVQTYLQAERAISDGLALAPSDEATRVELASARYTTHDFPGALALAGQVLAETPGQVGALAVAGDAQLELGRYQGAADAYAKVAAASPDAPAIEVRQARLAFILGQSEEARRLAAKAEDDAIASALGGADLAYYESYHGQVEFDTGHYDQAARFYGEAVEEAPDYYVALAGMARIRVAQGRTGDAIALYERAVAIVPQPDFVAALADLYALRGDRAAAATELGTVDVIARLASINQVVYNRLVALADADHGLKPDEALRLTQSELQIRHDVYGYDAYAWALYENGRYPQARAAEDHALAQGTIDAKLLYHSGMIAKALGDTVRAGADLGRALTISPVFDALQARRARAALAELRGGGA